MNIDTTPDFILQIFTAGIGLLVIFAIAWLSIRSRRHWENQVSAPAHQDSEVVYEKPRLGSKIGRVLLRWFILLSLAALVVGGAFFIFVNQNRMGNVLWVLVIGGGIGFVLLPVLARIIEALKIIREVDKEKKRLK